MDYISVKEAARRWGLTVGRINALANAGRIPGAQRIGRIWMIPADSTKPADGRYKQQLQTGKQYHFPLLLCYPYQEQSFLQGLSKDEQRLLEGQLACESCNFDQALHILKELLENTQQLYVRIGALYYLCSIAPTLNMTDLFKQSRTELCDILATKFPHQEDFRTILLDIDSLCLGNQIYVESFSLDNTQDYPTYLIPYLTVQSTFKDSLCSIMEQTPLSTNVLSLLCKNYEQSHLYYCAQFLYLFTACAFTGSKNSFINIAHLHKAIDIGIKHNFYRTLAVHYSYLKPAFDEVLKEYDPAIHEQIIKWSQIFDSNIISFLGNTASSVRTITELSEQQLQLMYYATQGLTNKEVSQLTKIPEYTIRRRFETLFNKFNVSNKKQLAALFIEALTDGYKS